MNAIRRRKELNDKCDAELQFRAEVKILMGFHFDEKFNVFVN